jgi:hypothetical protein
MWDLFICHASEDKEKIARPLAVALAKNGLQVWYDEFSLRIGDSLRRSIDKGLRDSQYGIVILSASFFKKEWPQKELDGLFALEKSAEKRIIPIWHDISSEQVNAFSPLLADKLGLSSSKGIVFLVSRIIEDLFPERIKPESKSVKAAQDESIIDNLVYDNVINNLDEDSGK